MLRIVIDVTAPAWAAQSVKEALAMELERYGDTRVVSVSALGEDEQLSLFPGASVGKA